VRSLYHSTRKLHVRNHGNEIAVIPTSRASRRLLVSEGRREPALTTEEEPLYGGLRSDLVGE
jgi:hypothetical protein